MKTLFNSQVLAKFIYKHIVRRVLRKYIIMNNNISFWKKFCIQRKILQFK